MTISYWGVDHGEEVHKAINPKAAFSAFRNKQVARVGQRAAQRGRQAAGLSSAPMGAQLSGRAGKMPKTFTDRSSAYATRSFNRGYNRQLDARTATQSSWTPRNRPD